MMQINTLEKKSESLYNPVEGTIVETRQMTATEKWFKIQLPEKRDLGHSPGQFVEVSILGLGEAPISISSSPTQRGYFELCVRRVGKITEAMHKLNVGDKLGIRGPFGHGFPVDELKGKDMLFVAGGLGIVPLRSLINFVIDKRKDFGKVLILLGCKEPAQILYTDEIERWGHLTDLYFRCTVDRAGPDWKGNVGLITELISGVDLDVKQTYVVVCGPPIMYKFVIIKLIEKKIPEKQILVSLERRMKCGLCKCGHCQIHQYYCCQDGPVFSYDKIKGLEGAI